MYSINKFFGKEGGTQNQKYRCAVLFVPQLAASSPLMPRGRDLFKHNKIIKTVTAGVEEYSECKL